MEVALWVYARIMIIISINVLKEKLQMIFDIDKEALKKQFPELYYCILAVLDEDKISTPGDYFKTDNS